MGCLVQRAQRGVARLRDMQEVELRVLGDEIAKAGGREGPRRSSRSYHRRWSGARTCLKNLENYV